MLEIVHNHPKQWIYSRGETVIRVQISFMLFGKETVECFLYRCGVAEVMEVRIAGWCEKSVCFFVLSFFSFPCYPFQSCSIGLALPMGDFSMLSTFIAAGVLCILISGSKGNWLIGKCAILWEYDNYTDRQNEHNSTKRHSSDTFYEQVSQTAQLPSFVGLHSNSWANLLLKHFSLWFWYRVGIAIGICYHLFQISIWVSAPS